MNLGDILRRVLRYWHSVWRQAIELSWRAMSFGWSTAFKWIVGVLVVAGGFYLAYGTDDLRKRLSIVGFGLLGSLLYLALSTIWYFFEIPSRKAGLGIVESSIGRTKVMISAVLSIVLAASFCAFWAVGAFSSLGAFVNPTPSPSSTPSPTPSSTSTNTPAPTPTPTLTPSQTPSLTPTPTLDYLPRGTCLLEGQKPCYHIVGPIDSLVTISFDFFGENRYAGRIADLIRTDDGRYAGLINGSVLIVPNPEHDRNLPYLQYYLGYSQCPPDLVNPEKPCVYVSTGEPYQLLASKFYTGPSQEILKLIQQANDIEYDPTIRDVAPIEQFSSGDFVILPRWP